MSNNDTVILIWHHANDGNLENILHLIKDDINLIDVVLKEAARSGHLHIIQHFIDYNNDSLLSIAAENGHYDIVEYLLKKSKKHNNEALRLSIDNGHLLIVKLLIDNGMSIDNNLLNISIRCNRIPIAKLLIENSTICNVTYELLRGLQFGHYKIVELFVKNGFHSVNVMKKSIHYGQLEIVKRYVENNDNLELYLLRSAIMQNQHHIFDYLLPHYNSQQLKKILSKTTLSNKILHFIVQYELSKYPILILLYREYGIDVFDLIEKEKIE